MSGAEAVAIPLTKGQWEQRVLEELQGMRLIMERQNTLLEGYMKKTDDLDERMRPVERHVTVVQAIWKGFLALALVGASLKAAHDAYTWISH